MNLVKTTRVSLLVLCSCAVVAAPNCTIVTTVPPGGTTPTPSTTPTPTPDANGDGSGVTALLQLAAYATNTDGASGMAVRPSDGALFVANPKGLFGPIREGDDLSTMTAFGATNLADDDLFDSPPPGVTLAITNAGEFWIGSECCGTLAIVPADGGDASPFLGLLQGSPPANIMPESLVIVPAGFSGPQIDPGNLLAGEQTTFSRLAAIDVAGDRAVVSVENASDLNREAHHLAFGPDGRLYGSRNATALTIAGIQTIDAQGTPTGLEGTLGVSAHSFIVRANGDLVIRGGLDTTEDPVFAGLIVWSAATQTAAPALAIAVDDSSEEDDMLVLPDGTILLSQPNRNEIVKVSDAD